MEDFGYIGRRGLIAGTAATSFAALLPRRARAADAPKQGGHFKVGVADYATSDTLDPANQNTRFQTYMQFQLRNCLIETGPGGKLVPELAESWEGSKDAKTWTFTLRKGVTFHNGKPLTPQDVIYSFNLHRGKDSKSSAKPMVSALVDIKADGPNKVAFELASGNVGFPAITSYVGFAIVPEGTTDFDAGVGTGGYILAEFKPGIRSVVKRNPNYWKSGRAHFDSVELIGMKDAMARANALISGEISAFNYVDPKTVSLLRNNAKLKLARVASKSHFVFAMLMDAAPFTNADVRTAMKLAIDREDLVKRVLHGLGTVGNDQPINAAYEFYDNAIPQIAYDPDKAKFLLKKAGASDLAVQLYVSETPFAGATDAAVLYREHAARAGIKIDVVKTPEDGYWDNVWDKKPFCATRWSGRINEDAMLSLAYTDEGMKVGWNETHMNDPRLNALVQEARGEFDEKRRRELYGECQRIIHTDGGANVFAFADFVDGLSTQIGHEAVLSGEWDMDGGRASERWWFI